jgi:hypothetical protein
MDKIRIATIISTVLLAAALLFAILGFSNSLNSEVPVPTVTIYMMVSAALFAILAVRGLARKEMWQRFMGVAAIVAAVYMVGMAILFFSVLSKVVSAY